MLAEVANLGHHFWPVGLVLDLIQCVLAFQMAASWVGVAQVHGGVNLCPQNDEVITGLTPAATVTV